MAAIEDNDKEISDLLASGDKGVVPKLPGLVQRFREDHDSKLEVFQALVAAAAPIAQPTSYATATSTPPVSNIALPTSLQSLQEYIPLLRSLLGISEQEAIRTLAIKNDTEDAGSVPFLLDCVDICYHQRAARIAAIGELVTNSSHDLLDVIDQSTTNSRGSPRGLFRMLLCSVCQADPPAPPMMRRPASVATDADWNAFLRFARDRQVAGRSLERFEAMNTLLVLLYNYMGVEPVDFGVLLVAFLEEPADSKLKSTVSLILGESVALWRTLVDSDENMGPLLDSHPLLKGGATSNDELQSLLEVLQKNNRPGWELATLSFGLLLHASEGPLSSEGLLLAKWANSDLDAFSVLHDVMSAAVLPAESKPEVSVDPLIPDQQFEPPSDVSEEVEELDSSVLAATIGREILSATLIAFRGVILPERKLPPIDDINRLATTAMVIFQNSPTLCKQFWDSWNASTDRPLVRLLQASWRLASQATESAKDGFRDRDEILRAMSPLLQLLSALVYDPETMRAALPAFLPPDIIRYAIDLLKFPSKTETMQSTRRKILSALANFSRIGASDKECREQLRSALELSLGSESISGPLALACTFAFSDFNSTSSILELLCNLVRGASKDWLVDAVRGIKCLQGHQQLWRTSFESTANSLPLAKLINSLIRRLDEVVFEGSIAHSLVEDILDTVYSSIRSLAANLVCCSHHKADHELAALIMDCLSLALGQALPIARFHKASSLRMKAIAFMEDILDLLAFKIGTHVFRYASFPVLVHMLEELDALNPTDTSVGTTTGSIFESHSGTRPSVGASAIIIQLETFIGEFSIEKLAKADESANRTRFDECKEGALKPALSSLRLLNAWVKTIKAGLELIAVQGIMTNAHLTVSAVSMLTSGSLVPPAAAKLNPGLGSNWDSYQIPVAALMMAYVNLTDSDVSFVFAMEALSFLTSTIAYLSAEPVENSRHIADIFAVLNHFGAFPVAFDKTLEAGDFRRLSAERSEGERKNEKIFAVHFLTLTNVFARCIPRECAVSLGKGCLERLVTSLHALTDMMDSIKRSTVDPLDLCFVTESTRCIKDLWKYERSGYGVRGVLVPLVSDDKTILQNLLHLALEQHETKESLGTKDHELLAAELSLIAIVVDILATEMHWTSSRPEDVSTMKAFLPTLTAFLPSETRLVDSSKYYNKTQDLHSCSEIFSALAGIQDHNKAVVVPESMSLSQFVSILSFQTIRLPLSGSMIDPFHEKLFDFASNASVVTLVSKYDIVDAQRHGLRSWTRFLFAFQNLLRADGVFKPVWSEGDVFQQIFSALLCALPNDKEGESGGVNPSPCPPSLSLEYITRIEAILRQLLILVKQKMDIDCATLCLGLHAIASTMNSLLAYRLEDDIICGTICCMVGCGSYLVGKASSSGDRLERGRLAQACVGVAKSVCYMLQSMKSSASSLSGHEASQQTQILDQAVALLLRALLFVCEADEANLLAKQMWIVFQDTGLLQSVSSRAVALRCSHAKESFLVLCTALVESSDVNAIQLLSDNRASISLILSDHCTLNADSAMLSLSLRFVACGLRKCAAMRDFKDSFTSVAASFIAHRKDRFLDIVREASSINFGRNLLDFQLMEQANQVMYILSLFCGGEQESIRPARLDDCLLQGLKEQASTLVSILSTYLGAACSTRALFRAVHNEIEPENVNEYDPCHRILLRGSSCTRRAATEFCNDFVKEKTTKMKTAFTRPAATAMSSWEQILQGKAGREDDWSDEEKRCIITVANDCVFEVECAVADCLFQTLRFLWSVHPARNSFVMYTAQEVAKLNTARIIHPGSIVAFRPSSGSEVLRGKVLLCDDLNMNWTIETVTGHQLHTYVVKKFQLMGVQENSNLVPCFQFGPVPETSYECSQLLSTPSLGHVLLAARWCRQHVEELQLITSPTNAFETVLQNLAEMTSIFIAEEASLHYESRHLINGNAFRTVQIQILDLFGESEDLDEAGMPRRHTQAVTFRAALSGSNKIWHATRQRLFPYLRDYAKARATMARIKLAST